MARLRRPVAALTGRWTRLPDRICGGTDAERDNRITETHPVQFGGHLDRQPNELIRYCDIDGR